MDTFSKWDLLCDKQIAIYWWVEAFHNDYFKYVEALFPDDEESQNNFLKNSNKFYRSLEYKVMNENKDLDISNISWVINLKVINIVNMFNSVIK